MREEIRDIERLNHKFLNLYLTRTAPVLSSANKHANDKVLGEEVVQQMLE